MIIDLKKSLCSFVVCTILFPNIGFATDDIIDGTTAHPNKTYSSDTTLNNLTITNDNNDTDAHSIATVNNNTNLLITNDLNLSTTNSDNAYIVVEDGSSIDINNTNMSQQTYIYGDGGDVTVSGLAHLENNASIESNNSIININQTTISSTAYIAGYGDSNITVNQATLDDNSTIGTENGTVTTNGAVVLDGNSSIYSQGDSLITTNGTVDINGTSNIFSNGGIAINGVTHLDGESFLDANNSNLNINANVVLDGNSSLYGMETNGTITSTTNGAITLNDTSRIYTQYSDINLSGDVIGKDSTQIYADNNGKLILNNITLEDNATAGTKDGTVTTNGAVVLDGNSSIYSQGDSLITTNGTVDINGTSNIFSNGGIAINGVTHLDGESFLDANNSNLNINANVVLDGNSSLYGMETNGTITSTTNGAITLNDTSRIYTQYSDINLSGDIIANDYSIIMADNDGNITLNNVTLDNNASIIGKNNTITINGTTSFEENSTIYATGTGFVTLNGVNTFDGNMSGIFVENNSTKDIYSKVNINLTNTTTLKNGAYIVSQGDGNISINKLNIIDSGFVIADKDINITDVNISDSGNFDYVLINSNDGNLTITNLVTPQDTNLKTYIVERTDTNLSVYRDFLDPAAFGLYGNDANTYDTLMWSLNEDTDKDLYDTMNNKLSNTQIKTAVQTMKPEITNASVGAISILDGSLSTISNYLQIARLESSKQGISTGDKAIDKNIWIQGFATSATQDDVDGVSGYDSTGNGVVIGIDKKMELDTTYGIAISFGTSDITGNDTLTNSSTDVTSKQLMFYFSRNLNTAYVEGYISKGWNDNSGKRDIILGTEKRTAYSSYGSTIKTIKLAYGDNLKKGRFVFTPNGSISSSIVSTNKYTETGASGANLTVDTKDMEKTTLLLGLKISTKFDFQSGGVFLPQISGSYKRDFGDNYSTATSQFRDADYTFISEGLKLDDYAMVYGTSLKYKSASGMSEYKLDFESTKSENYSSNTGSFTARFKF